MSVLNSDLLRDALAKSPVGSAPRSGPPVALDVLIKRAQNRLRPHSSELMVRPQPTPTIMILITLSCLLCFMIGVAVLVRALS